MKEFEVPQMSITKLTSENVFTNSQCMIEALGCPSCYCVAIECDQNPDPTCNGCYDDWDA